MHNLRLPTIVNIYYPAQFLWLRNVSAATWAVLAQGLSSSYSQDISWDCGYSKDLTGVEDSLPRRLTDTADRLVLAVGKRP